MHLLFVSLTNYKIIVVAAVASAAGVRIVAVAAGNQHSLALSEDGKVFAWGDGHYGALGLGPGMSTT